VIPRRYSMMSLLLQSFTVVRNKGVSKGFGIGVKTLPLSLIFYKNFITWAKKIKYFRILLLINLST